MKARIPIHVVEARVEICTQCPTPCADFRAKTINHADPCIECPLALRRWGQYDQCQDGDALQSYGLGDAVAVVAQPIARVIDAMLGTNIKGCGGCKKRQAALNKIVPKL